LNNGKLVIKEQQGLFFFIECFDKKMIQQSLDFQLVFLGLCALFAANMPFFRAKGSLPYWRVGLELCLGFYLCLVLSRFLESRHFSIFPQQPVFYGIIALLFSLLTLPGLVYRLLQQGKWIVTTDDTRLLETEVSAKELPVGKYFTWIQSKVLLPNGCLASREYLHHPGAVMVLPILDNGNILFERQYRHPGRQIFLELPAGKLHAGEDKLLCAQRELLEETGYQAKQWQHVGRICPAIGYSDEVIEIFLAKDLGYSRRQLDEEEFIETVELSVQDAIESVMNGKITDAKTISGIFWIVQLLQNN
jgi:ADP-ribose pyrophosphatase